MHTKTFSVTGWSGSGKTELIRRCIQELNRRGKKVITAKNVPHKYHLEPEAKDSYRFLEAGSAQVFLVAKKEIVCMQKNDREDKIFDLLKTQGAESDYILLEGIYRDGIPIIEVFDSQKNPAPKVALDKLAALVSDQKNLAPAGIPAFGFDEIYRLVEFMEAYDGEKNRS